MVHADVLHQSAEDEAKLWTVPLLYGTPASGGQPDLQLMSGKTQTLEVSQVPHLIPDVMA